MTGFGQRGIEDHDLSENPHITDEEMEGLDETLRRLVVGMPTLVQTALSRLPNREACPMIERYEGTPIEEIPWDDRQLVCAELAKTNPGLFDLMDAEQLGNRGFAFAAGFLEQQGVRGEQLKGIMMAIFGTDEFPA
jgi:hypothetical protein